MNKTPADFVPCFSVYKNETALRAVAAGFGDQAAAIKFAESLGMQSYVIRRSCWTAVGERLRGAVHYTKR